MPIAFAIALDPGRYDRAAARRCTLDDLLHELWRRCDPPDRSEDTLARLMAQGLAVAVPVVPLPEPPRVALGYPGIRQAGLAGRIKVELDARQPGARRARLIDEGDRSLLAVSGDFVSCSRLGWVLIRRSFGRPSPGLTVAAPSQLTLADRRDYRAMRWRRRLHHEFRIATA